MELSKRLQAVAGMVCEGNRLVDVGTDHGYIPIYLVTTNRIPGAIAMDVRKGPLSRAAAHIREAGLESYITCRLSDGLEQLEAGEGDSLLLAGMGGRLMVRILSERPEVTDSFQEMILQPQSAQALVRKTVEQAGWLVEKEQMILEDGKFYPMLRLVKGKRDDYCGEAEYAYGKLLLRQKDPVLKLYLDRQQQILSGLRETLSAQAVGRSSQSADRRLEELEQELEILRDALEYYGKGGI